MVKMTRVASVAALAGLALGLSFGAALPVQAKTTSDRPAAILYWPKIVVDTTGRFTAGTSTDTLIRLSNTATGGLGLAGMKQAHCFYIDANSHCSNSPTTVCQSGTDCGVGSCLPGWTEIDFDVVLTKDQPLTWHVGRGLRRGDFPLEIPGLCALPPVHSCVSDSECNGGCVRQQSNLGSGIPPVPEDPFIGSLQCIEYDPVPAGGGGPVPDQTATSNTLKGEATIEGTRNLQSRVDTATYNAVGIRFGQVEAGVPSNELHLDGVQYDTCPTTLILDHLFDVPQIGQTTDLTLVPCGNDFLTQTPGDVTAQFVVFNEFEQRFSTSRQVPCFLESALSSLDTPDPTRSIFSQDVSGTLGGQTRIRPVGNAPTGRGLVGVARLISPLGSAAYNLHQAGSPAAGSGIQPDVITIP